MDLAQRIQLMSQLGKYLSSNSQELANVKDRAVRQNAWFTNEFVEVAINNIQTEFLQPALLQQWLENYQVPMVQTQPKKVGIVMAGNIPLVGFHDFLCVFMSGHMAIIKPSSKDEVLIKHLVAKLTEWNASVPDYVQFADTLKGCDAYIATGSNNSSRYFDYYFEKYPHIIRRNRTSVAIIDGTETDEQLKKLASDIQLYFGLGCRNVTKIYVPEQYHFVPLLNALKQYDYYFEYHKYKNNYDYQLALLMMARKFYMTEGSIVLAEDTNLFSPVSQLNYEYYTQKSDLLETLQANESIQCIVGNGFIDFGCAQTPSLTNYADGVDTMQFLVSLK